MKFENPTIIEYSIDDLNQLISVSACSNGYCSERHCTSSYENLVK